MVGDKTVCARNGMVGSVKTLVKRAKLYYYCLIILQPSYPNGGKLEWSEGAHKFYLVRGRKGS